MRLDSVVTPSTRNRNRACIGDRMKFTSGAAQTLHNIIQWRRDVWHFRPDPVAPEGIEKLAASMEMALSVGKYRPWRVIRVPDPQPSASDRR